MVLLVGMCGRAFSLLRSTFLSPHADNETGDWKARTRSGLLWKLHAYIKTYITLPPAFGHRNHEPYGWATIPLRLQSIVIVAYVIMHILLMSIGINIFEGDL